MKTSLLQLLFPTGISLAIALLLFPVLIKHSARLGFMDIPNYRKLHRQPVPAIGGFVIMLSLILTTLFSSLMQAFVVRHIALTSAILILAIIGFFDDRHNLSVKLRLGLQLLCAIAIAYDGTRITSFHGLLGVHQLPISIQYIFTVLLITGVTNAFNLIDGIDGLAGSMALVNVVVLIAMDFFLGSAEWLFFLVPLGVVLIVFLKYNWRPARIFMGDSGSLFLGFMISAIGIHFIQSSGDNGSVRTSEFIVLVTGYCMIPVLDALRVFYTRMKKGHSPFHADRTHLHHLLTNHHLVHSTATIKLLKLHIGMLVVSAIAGLYLNIYWVVLGQIVGVVLYVHLLRMMSLFYRWYRIIKKMERAV